MGSELSLPNPSLERTLLDQYTNLSVDTQLEIQSHIANIEKVGACFFFLMTIAGLVTSAYPYQILITTATMFVLMLHAGRRLDLIEHVKTVS